jgi:hypothetical protein
MRYRTADAATLGRHYVERAATLEPQNARARSALADLRASERRREIDARLRTTGAPVAFDDFSDATYAAVSALPEQDRLFYLPGAAESAYMRAENIDYILAREKPGADRETARKRAAEGFARARDYANDALELAARHQQAADDEHVIYRAHTVLGVLALKDGNRRVAVEHMRAATTAPIPDARYTFHQGLRGRLVEYLLREGERETVSEYLEKSAERFQPERDQLLKDAAQIRAGVMPLSYQYAEARR